MKYEFLKNIKCPKTNLSLEYKDSVLKNVLNEEIKIKDGIFRLLKEPDQLTKKVKNFYLNDPFPDYNDFDTLDNFILKTSNTPINQAIQKLHRPGDSILEIGCGTGQLSLSLASTCHAQIYGADISINSLILANEFKKKNNIKGIEFFETDIFNHCFVEKSFDIVISNGVLHHTKDPYLAFEKVVSLTKDDGYILIGLYNSISRLKNSFIRYLSLIFGDKIIHTFDSIVRRKNSSSKKSWINDQYKHVLEKRYNFNELHQWFDKTNIDFINSVPSYDDKKELYEKVAKGDLIDQFNLQIKDLFINQEGGLFLFLGKKKKDL